MKIVEVRERRTILTGKDILALIKEKYGLGKFSASWDVQNIYEMGPGESQLIELTIVEKM